MVVSRFSTVRVASRGAATALAAANAKETREVENFILQNNTGRQ
jgi:hypothetical protein